MDKTKSEIRQASLSRRKELEDRQPLSNQIVARLGNLDAYQQATTPLIYVSVRSEVSTTALLRSRIAEGKTTLIPYCHGQILKLFKLQDMDQLVKGAFGIPEPRRDLRQSNPWQATTDEMDAAVVPGVAFDMQGRRIGYGKGYFDRLLRPLSSVTKIGLAFDCQIFDTVPEGPQDVAMDYVITESRIIYGPDK